MKDVVIWGVALCFSTLALAGEAGDGKGLTAPAIIEKNAAARGGLEAWRKVQTMSWVGHIESAHAPQPSLPFAMEMKRPNKTRFEIMAPGQASVRIYDGVHGWKLRQTNQGKPEAQPYTPEELSSARDGQGIDGVLMDHQAKGIEVALDGMDEVEGRRAYRLSVKLPSGTSQHVWVDAETFLELKYDRVSHDKFGQSGTVSVFYRNYRTVDGLQIPQMIEIRSDHAKASDRMVIDKVLLNPPLEDKAFAYSPAAGRGKMAAGSGGPQSARNHQTVQAFPPGMPRPAFSGPASPGSSMPGMPPRSARGGDVQGAGTGRP